VPARSLAEWSGSGEIFAVVVDVFVYIAAFETTDGVLSCPRTTAAHGRLQADGAILPPAPRSALADPRGPVAIAAAPGAARPRQRVLAPPAVLAAAATGMAS
jgi:hypothetical protein